MLGLLFATMLLLAGPAVATAQHMHAENKTPIGCVATPEELAAGKPGDFNYLHDYYHRCGTIEQLRRSAETECCGGTGECRATYVKYNRLEKKVLLDGQWCPITEHVKVRFDVQMPDGKFALACASKYPSYEEGGGDGIIWGDSHKPCPYAWCIALPGGY